MVVDGYQFSRNDDNSIAGFAVQWNSVFQDDWKWVAIETDGAGQ